jgi:predicted alpha/beta hydrolase family esterase
MWEATQELKTRLTTGVGGRPPVIAKKNLFFVVHSLGGILVRALLRQYKDEFEGKRIGVLLVASPSMGSSIAYLASVWHLLTRARW